jgi:nicotinate dehydrogenase subunit A
MQKLMVNGQVHAVECAPDTPLLYALRNDLGLTGAKYGCGMGQCGACHVLINGRSVASCDISVESCAQQQIETIESLTPTGEPLHPLQAAFIQAQAGQCGYCLGGILSSARALLRHNPKPSRADIVAALDRHLCRCGTHQRIIQAIQIAADAMQGAQP